MIGSFPDFRSVSQLEKCFTFDEWLSLRLWNSGSTTLWVLIITFDESLRLRNSGSTTLWVLINPFRFKRLWSDETLIFRLFSCNHFVSRNAFVWFCFQNIWRFVRTSPLLLFVLYLRKISTNRLIVCGHGFDRIRSRLHVCYKWHNVFVI